MSEFIKIRHSYNAGDLVGSMAGLQQVYNQTGKNIKVFQRLDLPSYYFDGQINSTIDKDGNSVCMNKQMFNMLKPLIESQFYIESFEVWQGEEVDLDYDLTRDTKSIPMPSGTIHSWYQAVFPETSTDLSLKWLEVSESIVSDKYRNKILVNRSMRYQNPYITYYFLKQYENDILFSGTDAEYHHFCNQWNLSIEKLQIDNFYQLAQVIKWCKFGVYNQSMTFHISDAQKTPRILELCAPFPNTFITGANGYQFYRQQALEFYVNKLMKQ